MRRLVFAIPGDIEARTGGYGYDRRVLAELAQQGVAAVHLALPGGFPHPTAEEEGAVAAILARELTAEDVALIDGLAYGALSETAIAAIAAPIVALCHHPLCLEAWLAPERAAALRESERRALARAAHVIATSAHTGETLIRDFGVCERKLTIAPPGTDPAERARGSGGAPALLAVGSIIPRKAFHLLVEALSGLCDLDWRLAIVGGAGHSPQTATDLAQLIEAKGLGGRIALRGELSGEALDAVFHRADVFVSASLHEGYGMALAEALARGLPIVATTGGAAGDTIPDSAALKIPPGDVAALREALRAIIAVSALRARLGEASWRAGRALPRWEETARIIANVAREAA
ncbi:glycosyl transferase [Methylosinus sp. C49]|uniref:glycosyltransferase family 4 protein n=1 Tax=Methylosinus sp. C49 TaxID=2699395 RepID=UPI001366F161|nr:glycosyltransferase family 4 protein [Methylosinus sp. C49]BBU62695.1 glycosyl transferase [Methylosinus sp. C49]